MSQSMLAERDAPLAQDIPSGWSVRRLREAVELMNGFPFDSSIFNNVSGKRVVRIRDLLNPDQMTFYSGPAQQKARINDGDMLIGMDGDFNVVMWRGGPAVLNQRMCCLRPRDGTDMRFVGYLLPEPLRIVNDLTYYTTVKHIASKQILDIQLLDPGPIGQRAIADFLDRKTQALDALIQKKERLIALLQEKRQALITQAVTKGLDPNVPMKDSGIEWLGEIPAHWDLAPVYARYEVQLGKMLDAKRITGDHLAPYLRNVDIQWDRINLDDLPTMDFTPNDRAKFVLEPGDLLVCEGGEVGRCAVWQGEIKECYYQKALHRVRPSSDKDNTRFLYYVMFAVAKCEVFVAQGNPNTIDHLTAEKLRRYRFPFPPRHEQEAICGYLDSIEKRIATTIETVSKQIDLLREYRQALISAAVTGKIDVTTGRPHADP